MAQSLFRKDRKVLFNYLASVIVSLTLSLYNGITGIFYDAIWNECISFYYFLLLIVRTIIFVEEYRKMKHGIEPTEKAFIFNSVTLLVITVSLSYALYLLAKLQEPVKLSNVPAIVLFVMLVVKFITFGKKCFDYGRTHNIFDRQIMIVSMTSTGYTLITFTNTLLVFSNGFDWNRIILFILITVFVLMILIGVTLYSLVDGIKEIRKKKKQG